MPEAHPVTVRPARYADADVQRLVAAAMADLRQRYGGGDGDATPVDPAQFDPPDGGFFVAELDGAPVGCGGWRSYAAAPGTAEIKRMYTAPEARRLGVALAVLTAVEESARRAGRTRIILETGLAQPEALALYARAGYQPIENFGHYRGYPDCRSFGRDL